jgi:hypothetical protein
MQGRGRWVTGFVAGAVLATSVTVATSALAGGSSRAGTLHACAAKQGGALRIASKCTTKERAVTWNVRGPRGARGKPGADGAGPAYYSGQVGSTPAPSGTPAAITHVTLPPGFYTVVATAVASTSNLSGDDGSCQLSGGGLFDQASSFTVTTNHSESVTVTAIAHTTDVDNQVFLVCGGDHAVTIGQGLITATRVTSGEDQTPAG